jgi:hypothetical protein
MLPFEVHSPRLFKKQSKFGKTMNSNEEILDASAQDELQPAPARRQRHKISLPPELECFGEAQIEEINNLLRTRTYAEVQEFILLESGIRISINKLFRYYQKLELAEALDLAENATEGVQQLLNFYNAQAVDLDKAGLQTIKQRALQLACSPSTKPTLLLQLMRIFTWEHRKSMDDHRKQMDLDKAAHRNRLAQIAERRAQCQERRLAVHEQRSPAKNAPLPCPPDGNLTPYLSEDAQKILAVIRGNRPDVSSDKPADEGSALPNRFDTPLCAV